MDALVTVGCFRCSGAPGTRSTAACRRRPKVAGFRQFHATEAIRAPGATQEGSLEQGRKCMHPRDFQTSFRLRAHGNEICAALGGIFGSRYPDANSHARREGHGGARSRATNLRDPGPSEVAVAAAGRLPACADATKALAAAPWQVRMRLASSPRPMWRRRRLRVSTGRAPCLAAAAAPDLLPAGTVT